VNVRDVEGLEQLQSWKPLSHKLSNKAASGDLKAAKQFWTTMRTAEESYKLHNQSGMHERESSSNGQRSGPYPQIAEQPSEIREAN